ncbi:MAG: 16S rRNA processing protein RimM [Muribaculaceae bacterium]|nr:16S rRNA processing protein RimM [Muribaculaceae bacterium]
MIRRDELKEIGKFQKTHALKGELNMLSEVDPEYFLEGNPLIVDMDGIFAPFYATSIRQRGSQSYLIKLDGIDNENEASRFVNQEIFMLRRDVDEWLEDPDEEEEALIGFRVVDFESGEEIGTVEGIEDSTVNVLFIVEGDEGEEIYLPATEDFIESIDEESGKIYMRLPEGLIDLNKKRPKD